jgi:hypothetical protein
MTALEELIKAAKWTVETTHGPLQGRYALQCAIERAEREMEPCDWMKAAATEYFATKFPESQKLLSDIIAKHAPK